MSRAARFRAWKHAMETKPPQLPLQGPFYPITIEHGLGSVDLELAIRNDTLARWYVLLGWPDDDDTITVDLPAGIWDVIAKARDTGKRTILNSVRSAP